MTTKSRIETIRLLEQIQNHKAFCREAGVYDASTFMGRRVTEEKIPDRAFSLTGDLVKEQRGRER